QRWHRCPATAFPRAATGPVCDPGTGQQQRTGAQRDRDRYGGVDHSLVSAEFLIRRGAKLLDARCPIEWSHPLNRGLEANWAVPPLSGWRGALVLRDLVRGGKAPND